MRGQRNNLRTTLVERQSDTANKRIRPLLHNAREGCIDFETDARAKELNLDPNVRSGGLQRFDY